MVRKKIGIQFSQNALLYADLCLYTCLFKFMYNKDFASGRNIHSFKKENLYHYDKSVV